MKREKKNKIIVAGVFGLLARDEKKMKGRKGQKVKNMSKKAKNR
ncbi:MAG: hypothetical protein ACFFBP_13575 [Promethearchaeota archaeon]